LVAFSRKPAISSSTATGTNAATSAASRSEQSTSVNASWNAVSV